MPENCPNAVPSDEVRFRATDAPLISPEIDASLKQSASVEVIEPDISECVDPTFVPCASVPVKLKGAMPLKLETKLPVNEPLNGWMRVAVHVPVSEAPHPELRIE